jgi:hypothetical protein
VGTSTSGPQDHDSLPGDARKSYHAAVALVATVIGQDFSDGKIVINPRLVGYLERKGVYQPRENPTVEHHAAAADERAAGTSWFDAEANVPRG